MAMCTGKSDDRNSVSGEIIRQPRGFRGEETSWGAVALAP